MKNLLLTFVLLAGFTFTANAQNVKYEYLQVSAVESVVSGGLGRSRLITTTSDDQIIEKELKNFFSMVGINFNNIRNNDQVIAERLSELSQEGWDLHKITSGVYGADKSTGLFITRYIFRRVAAN